MIGGAQDVLRLPGALDLAAAEGFLETIRQQLKLDRTLCLDASEVETLTLPCIQIILAAVTAYEVSIVNPSAAFASAFHDLALDWNAGHAVDGGRQADAPACVEPAHAPEPVQELRRAPEPEPAPEPTLACGPEPVHELQPAPEPEPAPEPTLACESEPVHESQPASEPAATHEPAAAREPEPAYAPDPMPAQVMGHVPDPNPDKVVEQEPIHEPTDGTSMSKRILTIDDSKTMRDMLLMTLAEAGFDVLQAVDGQDGLDVLGTQRVDVIITDINMPVMDGYEVIRNLRKNPVHKTTPILVLTTESDADKKVIARDAGATGWMVKPFDPDRLIATIRKVAP
jgi:two-component system chemotaxis response regulator CheY